MRYRKNMKTLYSVFYTSLQFMHHNDTMCFTKYKLDGINFFISMSKTMCLIHFYTFIHVYLSICLYPCLRQCVLFTSTRLSMCTYLSAMLSTDSDLKFTLILCLWATHMYHILCWKW